jgi:S-layer homology domain
MAAFMIRALGEFTPPPPPSQRFADVPPSNPFYAFIDRMAALQITLGCGNGNYCPSDNVTRGQMAAFLVRAFGL